MFPSHDPTPPQYFVFAAYTFFNFPPSTAIGFQALKIQDDDDSSPLTGTWFPTDNMFYMPYNGELTKLTVTVNSNIGAFFRIKINPPPYGVVNDTTSWDYETLLESNGSYTKHLIEPNLSINLGDSIGMAVKTNSETTRLYDVTAYGLIEIS